MTLDFVVHARGSRASGPRSSGRNVASGVLSGLAFAALILFPRSIFGGSFTLSIAPILLAVALLGVGAFARGTRLRLPRGFWVFSAVVVSGYFGAVFTGLLDDAPAVMIAAMVPVWLFCGNLTDRERRIALLVVIAAATVAAVSVILEHLMGASFFASGVFPHSNPLLGGIRAKGTLPHPLVASFVFLIVWMMALRAGFRRRTLVAVSVVFGWAILATGSSSAVLVAVVMLAWMLLVGRSGSAKTGRALGLITLATIAYLAFPSAFSVTEEVSPESNMHRVNSILAIPRLLLDRPLEQVMFGSGWGAVQHLYDSRLFDNDRFYAIDNQFVAMLALGGVTGLIAYIALIIGVLTTAQNRAMVLPFVAAVAMGFSFDFIFSPPVCALFVFVATWALGAPADHGRGVRNSYTVLGANSPQGNFSLYRVSRSQQGVIER